MRETLALDSRHALRVRADLPWLLWPAVRRTAAGVYAATRCDGREGREGAGKQEQEHERKTRRQRRMCICKFEVTRLVIQNSNGWHVCPRLVRATQWLSRTGPNTSTLKLASLSTSFSLEPFPNKHPHSGKLPSTILQHPAQVRTSFVLLRSAN